VECPTNFNMILGTLESTEQRANRQLYPKRERQIYCGGGESNPRYMHCPITPRVRKDFPVLSHLRNMELMGLCSLWPKPDYSKNHIL